MVKRTSKGISLVVLLFLSFLIYSNRSFADDSDSVAASKEQTIQEIEEVIQQQVPDEKIVSYDWSKVEKASEYVSFIVVTAINSSKEINISQKSFTSSQLNQIEKWNTERIELNKEVLLIFMGKFVLFWFGVMLVISIITAITILVKCIFFMFKL